MGYKKRKLYKLTWDKNTDFEGLEVVMSGVPFGRMLEMQSAASAVDDKGNVDPQRLSTVVDMLVDSLVSWNIEHDDDSPVPTTREGVLSRDASEVMAIMSAWMDSITGVADPLPKRSPDGSTYPEASIPMEILSPSLVS